MTATCGNGGPFRRLDAVVNLLSCPRDLIATRRPARSACAGFSCTGNIGAHERPATRRPQPRTAAQARTTAASPRRTARTPSRSPEAGCCGARSCAGCPSRGDSRRPVLQAGGDAESKLTHARAKISGSPGWRPTCGGILKVPAPLKELWFSCSVRELRHDCSRLCCFRATSVCAFPRGVSRRPSSAYPVPRIDARQPAGRVPRDRKEKAVSTATYSRPRRTRHLALARWAGAAARGCLGHPRAACPQGGQLRHGRGGRSALAAGRAFCTAILMTAGQVLPEGAWPGRPAPGTGRGAVARPWKTGGEAASAMARPVQPPRRTRSPGGLTPRGVGVLRPFRL